MNAPRPIQVSDLISLIEGHCNSNGVSLTDFGRNVTGSGSLVTQLRRGSDPRLSTVNKILEAVSL